MKLLRFFGILIMLWYCSTQSMDGTKECGISAMPSFSISSLPEDVLLKIWITRFKKTVIYRLDNIYTIMRPVTAASCVCRAWNILWTKEKKKLSDAAHAIKDPIYMKYSTAGCVIS
jgi:hypothetical protein